MNRLAAFLSIFVAPAFLLLGPRQSFGQTQLGSERVAVPSPFRTSPFDRDRYLQVPRGFQIQVVARIPAARFLRPTPEGGLLDLWDAGQRSLAHSCRLRIAPTAWNGVYSDSRQSVRLRE